MFRRRQFVVSNDRSQRGLMESLESRVFLSAVKIMPLGDSITEADTTHSGYRYWLYKELAQSGFDVDFVGSNHGAYGGAPLYGDFDQDHEGHSGWRADTLAAGLTSWAPTYRPDIALVHVGTNDIGQGQTTASTDDDVKTIIDELRAANPNVTVLLAEIIPSVGRPTETQQFNATLPALSAAKSTAQSKVILVDQWTGFNVTTDTYDGIHPNEGGAHKVAAKWFSAVYAALRPNVTVPAPPNVIPGAYLSDLTPTSVTNFWGPWEKDKSNGEQYAGDGHAITLNGKTYAKGIGLHAGAELRESLAGHYAHFHTELGVDDEVGNAGSVDFKILADDVLLYDSGKMTGATATKTVDLDVTGKTTLKLIVENAGDGNQYDHADFADAQLLVTAPGTPTTPVITPVVTTPPPPAPIVTPPVGIPPVATSPVTTAPGAGTPTYLGDLTAISAVNGWGNYEKNKSNNEQGTDGRTITLNGKAYSRGLGTHAGSAIIFNVPMGAVHFVSDIGIDDEVGNAGSVVFKVYSGAALLYSSMKLTGASATQTINLDLTGATQLKLVVEDAGDGNQYDHADWADARVL